MSRFKMFPKHLEVRMQGPLMGAITSLTLATATLTVYAYKKVKEILAHETNACFLIGGFSWCIKTFCQRQSSSEGRHILIERKLYPTWMLAHFRRKFRLSTKMEMMYFSTYLWPEESQQASHVHAVLHHLGLMVLIWSWKVSWGN